jgi:hypothetical protein
MMNKRDMDAAKKHLISLGGTQNKNSDSINLNDRNYKDTETGKSIRDDRGRRYTSLSEVKRAHQ